MARTRAVAAAGARLFDETLALERRLRERRSDAAGEIARRLARAREEIALWRQYDYLIVNRDLKEAAEQLTAIIVAERSRASRLALGLPDLPLPQQGGS